MRDVAFIGLGSNLGHPRRRLARALAQLARLPRSRLVAASRNYVSAPMDCTEAQPDYVNAVAELCERLGANVAGMGFIVELAFLGGRGKLDGYDAVSLISYD